MNPKFNAFFVIALILFSMFPVQAAPPVSYNKELASDVALRGALFTDGDATGFYASYVGDSIQISSTNHYTDKTIKIKGTALTSRLKMYNGLKVGYTHVADDGTVTHEIKPLVIDNQGFAYLTADFSTVIISGMTGYTTTTHSSQSGNQSFSVPDGSSYDLNITNNQLGVVNATGGVLTTDGTDNIHTFLSNGTFIPDNNFNVSVLVIAGGGGGSRGGGGAGGFLYEVSHTVTAQQYSITVGAGGTGASSNAEPGVGGNSAFSTIIATTGGGGGAYTGENGGSGGGGGADSGATWLGGTATPSPSQGNNGGGSGYTPTPHPSGGGGGAGAIGQTSPDGTTSGAGGAGLSSTILDGTTRWYAGGGGGACYNAGTDGTATNGGGAGGVGGTAGTANTGGGGGGARTGYTGGNGGSGIVIIRYNTAQGEVNITATIPGDSDTQSYNASQPRAFTLTPTSTTNFVNITTTSTDYDITITTYWTEDTTLQSETATAGYAKQYINYTPSSDITSADLKTTFTFVFADQDYIGTATSTLNDVSKPTTRAGQDVNASVGSLTADTLHYWNVTVPYNNVFTLSNQSNYTIGFGDVVPFIDSNYSDPEGLAIDTIYWQFGDGNTSTASNPTHQYSSAGNYTANVTVTETATVSPQSITKGFYVFVLPSYDVSGYVFDTDNNPLGLALISNNQTTEEVYTNISGYYILSDLYQGSILINATKSSFSNGSTISNVIDTNLYNQNITLSAIEYTSLEIMNKLLEIQAGQDGNTTVPETTQPQNSMPLPLFIVWALILIGLVYVAYPKRDDEDDLEIGIKNITASFISLILAFTLAKISINGQLIQTYSGISAINTVVTDVVIIQIGWLGWLFTFIGITMVILTIYLLVSEYNYRYGDDEDE